MSSYKGHLFGGVFIYMMIVVGAAFYTMMSKVSFAQLIEWLLCTLAGALFPDLDIKSIGQKWFYRALACASIVLLIYEKQQAFTIVSLCGLVPLLVNHRGILHRSWFILSVASIYMIVIAHVAPSYIEAAFVDACFFVLGAFSHLWLDGGWRLLIKI
jgi:hypothetical protein